MVGSIAVVVVGGAGNGLVVAQIVDDLSRAGKAISCKGFLNDRHEIGESIGGYPVLGRPQDWKSLDERVYFVFALLSVGKMKDRANKIKALEIPSIRLASLVHPTAVIANDVKLAGGCVVGSHVTCQPGSSIGENSIVRAGANVGHDVNVMNYVDIGPNSTLCGYATIKDGVHIAPNSVVRDRVSVGSYSVLGAGSVALKDIGSEEVWMGNPARRVR